MDMENLFDDVEVLEDEDTVEENELADGSSFHCYAANADLGDPAPTRARARTVRRSSMRVDSTSRPRGLGGRFGPSRRGTPRILP